MKKQILFLATLFLGFFASAQQPADSLHQRIEYYMKLNREAKFEQILDCVHPSLFKHFDRQAILESFQQFYNNAQQRISIDSTTLLSVSPEFTWHDTTYCKVDYEMMITLRIKDSTRFNEPGFITNLTHALQQGFPGSKVYFNPINKFFEVKAQSMMIAVRDTPKSRWMFLGYQKNEGFIRALFPEAVIRQFSLL
jgi:hypothetical protein